MITHTRVHLQTLVLLFFAGKHIKKYGKMSSVLFVCRMSHPMDAPAAGLVGATWTSPLNPQSAKQVQLRSLLSALKTNQCSHWAEDSRVTLYIYPFSTFPSALLSPRCFQRPPLFPCVCMSPSVKRERKKGKQKKKDEMESMLSLSAQGGLWVT